VGKEKEEKSDNKKGKKKDLSESHEVRLPVPLN